MYSMTMHVSPRIQIDQYECMYLIPDRLCTSRLALIVKSLNPTNSALSYSVSILGPPTREVSALNQVTCTVVTPYLSISLILPSCTGVEVLEH